MIYRLIGLRITLKSNSLHKISIYDTLVEFSKNKKSVFAFLFEIKKVENLHYG